MAGPIRQRHLQRAAILGIVLAFLTRSLQAFQRPELLRTPSRSSTHQPQLQQQLLRPQRFPDCLLPQTISRQFPCSPAFGQNRITLARAASGGIPDHEGVDKGDVVREATNGPPAAKVVGRRRRRLRKFVFGVAALWLATFAPLKGYNGAKSALASAPVMVMPKTEGQDPALEAMLAMERKQGLQRQKDLNDMAREARRIEAEQGPAARIKYEREYEANKQRQAAEKAAGMLALKKELLIQGICPFVDMEGQRQVFTYRTGVDLAETPGTPFYMEKLLNAKKSPKAYSVRMEQQRKVIACMVQDMVNRDIDPVDYFEKHQDKTQSILELPRDKAALLVERYTANLELYGQITVPKPGEMSVKEKIEASRDPAAEAKRLKEEKVAETKRLKEEKQAKAAELKAAQKAERERKKEEARLEKEMAKKGSKTAMKSAATATVALGTSALQGSASKVAGTLDSARYTLLDAPTQTQQNLSPLDADDSSSFLDSGRPSVSSDANAPSKQASASKAPAKKSPFSSSPSSMASKIISPKVIGGIVVVGGGAVAFKMYSDKSAADELERQRQFQQLMGKSDFTTKKTKSGGTIMNEFLDEEDDEDEDDDEDDEDSEIPSLPVATPMAAAAPVKKPRLGISLFNKKGGRETDIYKLVGASSPNAEFASALAKLLTFGAPGRFPSVAALPGSMPIEEYDLEAATETLVDVKGDLSQSDTVELFASVVNCMLIDILDLASSALSLKKGKEDATIDALNIVVDFMNHAAELFGAVAGNDVVIDPPVRYEGSMGRAKLEQMFGMYASAGADLSAMLMGMDGTEETPSNLREDHGQRVAMLQDVFGISEKKAEGIVTKAAQKNMMEMMKKPEKMAELMEKMGGEEGIAELAKQMEAGGAGMDPAMMEAMENPEKLLPELKKIRAMVEDGTFPKSELKDIQKQFKTAFGSDDIEAALLEGRGKEDLSEMEREFLEAMSVIMKA